MEEILINLIFIRHFCSAGYADYILGNLATFSPLHETVLAKAYHSNSMDGSHLCDGK